MMIFVIVYYLFIILAIIYVVLIIFMSFYGFTLYDMLVFSQHSGKDANAKIISYLREKNPSLVFLESKNGTHTLRGNDDIFVDTRSKMLFTSRKAISLDYKDPDAVLFFAPMLLRND